MEFDCNYTALASRTFCPNPDATRASIWLKLYLKTEACRVM
jgi:hypothetical protein